ncbi:MAG: response regulator transcription factor [Sedimentibacter sp.]
MNHERKILIVDDDIRVVKMLVEYMKLYEFKTVCAYNGRDALAFFDDFVDLVVLDINMEDINGIEVCQKIRENSNVPIIMLSANATSFDKIKALGEGADDYVVKPFDPMELIARIKAHINRVERYKASKNFESPIEFDDIKIYHNAYKITKGGVDISLSNTEFRLLVYLIDNAFNAVSRQKILKDVWQSDMYDENIVNTYIKRIRIKLDDDGNNEKYIKSIRGVGYMFEAEFK